MAKENEDMDDRLSRKERDALSSMGDDLKPPGELEDRVIAALRQRDLVAPPRARWSWSLVAAAVIAAVAFALGAQYGGTPETQYGGAPTAPAEGRRYLLMLLEPAGSPLPAAEEAARVEEYRAWAGGLAQEGSLLAGEKLVDASDVVGGIAPIGESPERVTGFFIVVADSRERALELARDCPHVRHGGRVEVREIEPT